MSSPLSGFTAVPNPQMLAFMPIQSYLMMYFAGAGWQIGKRKISAIPNNEFNKMSANDLLKGFTADLRETIPTLERSLQDITPLIKILIEQYGDFVTVALKEIPQAAQGVIERQLTKEGTLSKLIIEVVGGGTTTGGGAGSKALLFAQVQLQAEVDRLKAERDKLTDSNLDPNKFKPSTISGLSVQQAQEQAQQKQLKFEEQQREFEKLKKQQAKVGTAPIVPQVPVGFKFKKAAGQSQKMERLRLIKLIAQLAKDAKYLDAEPARKHAFQRMLFEQQQLVNLLARYSF